MPVTPTSTGEVLQSGARADRLTPAAASRPVVATTGQIALGGSSVPTRPWSATRRSAVVSQHIRCAHADDAGDRPPGRAACWASSPGGTHGRSDTCTSSPACSVPDECPTSALSPPWPPGYEQSWLPLRTLRARSAARCLVPPRAPRGSGHRVRGRDRRRVRVGRWSCRPGTPTPRRGHLRTALGTARARH